MVVDAGGEADEEVLEEGVVVVGVAGSGKSVG